MTGTGLQAKTYDARDGVRDVPSQFNDFTGTSVSSLRRALPSAVPPLVSDLSTIFTGSTVVLTKTAASSRLGTATMNPLGVLSVPSGPTTATTHAVERFLVAFVSAPTSHGYFLGSIAYSAMEPGWSAAAASTSS